MVPMRSIFFFLKQILFFLQQHAVKIAVVVGTILLSIGLLARLLFPELFAPRYEVEFSGERTSEKTSAAIAQADWIVPQDQFGPYLAESFALPESTPEKTTYYNSDTQQSLNFSPDGSIAEYSNTANQPGTAPITLQTGEQLARTFLQGLGYPTELSLMQVKYFAADDLHFEESSPEEADIYSFEFVPEVESLPVTALESQTNVLSVFVSGNGVFKATLRPLFLDASVGESQNLKSVDEALDDLSLGNFTSPQITPGALRQGTFQLQEQILMYAFGQRKDTLEPVYRFTGTYRNPQGQTLPVEVYVNAIE